MSFFLEFDAKNNILGGRLDGLVTDAILLDCYEQRQNIEHRIRRVAAFGTSRG